MACRLACDDPTGKICAGSALHGEEQRNKWSVTLALVARCNGVVSVARRRHSHTGELTIQRRSVETEHARGEGLVLSGSIEHAQDVAPLDLFQWHELGGI